MADLKLVYSYPEPGKHYRTVEENALIRLMKVNGGRVPTLEEFLRFIYSPDDVPDGATLELNIPAIIQADKRTKIRKGQNASYSPKWHASAVTRSTFLSNHNRIAAYADKRAAQGTKRLDN